MEVMAGYKQTELGRIPSDWNVRSLGELGEALIGLTYRPSDVRECGILVLRSSNIQGDALAFDDNVFVDVDVPERIMVRAGDVLICVRNGSRNLIGKSALIDDRATGMTFGAFMAVYRSSIGKFSGHLFRSEILKRQINEHLGATINQITNKSLNSFRIPLPEDEREQAAIAEALSDADALIESLEQLVAKKCQIKQGAMQELLTGKRRLPGFGARWEVATIEALEKGGLLSLSRGKVISKKDIAEDPGDYPIYSSSVHNNGLFGSYGKYMLDEELITWSVDGGGHFFYRPSHKFSVTNVCGYMRVNAGAINCRFLASQLQLLHAGKSFDYLAKAHPSVIRKDYELLIPRTEEQAAIATVLSDIDAEISELESKLTKARAIKQGMMQELLTGKTRLI